MTRNPHDEYKTVQIYQYTSDDKIQHLMETDPQGAYIHRNPDIAPDNQSYLETLYDLDQILEKAFHNIERAIGETSPHNYQIVVVTTTGNRYLVTTKEEIELEYYINDRPTDKDTYQETWKQENFHHNNNPIPPPQRPGTWHGKNKYNIQQKRRTTP